jgi:hypothetical protein
MRVDCIANTASDLSEKHFMIGYTDESVLNLARGRNYKAFGISLYRGVLHFLVCDETDLPNWYPSEVFQIVDPKIPSHWLVFSRPDNAVGLQLLISYPAMIEDEFHYDDLLERDTAALDVFRKELEGSAQSI